MEKNYDEIKFKLGSTIDSVVTELIEYNSEGKAVKGCYNGHMLYSDTVTYDNAYLEITGKSKAEFNKDLKELRRNSRREYMEYESNIPELTKYWTEKGHSILNEKYWSTWDKGVPVHLDGLYRGLELKCCLAIIEPLNNGCNLDEAKEIIENQDHSGMSFNLVREMVRVLCDRGEEFAEYIG